MTTIEELEHIMETEVEVGEALLFVLAEKQRSIVGIHGDTLSAVTIQEQKLLKPFEELEGARSRVVAALLGGGDANVSPADRGITIHQLLECLPAGDAVRISTIAARLRTVVERILHMNEQNRILLQRSLRFVQETLRLVTDDHTRQLVDHRA